MQAFEKLGLGKGLLATIMKLRFEKPSEIQEKAIPLVLEGLDVIGQAATGSGKTLAFGAGIIQNMRAGHGIKALIMTPTRELAEQVANSLRRFAENYEWNIIEIYGGVSMGPQIRNLEEADIVVGTPGRILDHLQKRTMQLNNVQYLVLDEADRMVDMGFLPDVERIISMCPKKRQTMLFSATMSPDINYVSGKYMIHPKLITVESYVDASKLKQVFYDVASNEKFSLFLHLIKEDTSDLAMVFCNTRMNVDLVVDNLKSFGVDALAIHGGINQGRRSRTLEDFHNQNFRVLVCTDVAARGLDIKNVTHVYNYDVPKQSTDYIHRIGRTARAGKEGEAITLVSQSDYENFRRVLDDSSLHIEQKQLPEFERVRARFSRNRGYDGQNGGYRGSSRGFGSRGGGRSYGGRSYGGGGFRSGGFGSRGPGGGNRGGFRERSRDGGGSGGGYRGGSGGGRGYGGSRGGSRDGGRGFGGRRSY